MLRIRLHVAEPANTIWLNAHRLTFKSSALVVKDNTVSGTATASGDDYVAIAFDRPVPTGESELIMQYRGESMTFFDFRSGFHHNYVLYGRGKAHAAGVGRFYCNDFFSGGRRFRGLDTKC